MRRRLDELEPGGWDEGDDPPGFSDPPDHEGPATAANTARIRRAIERGRKERMKGSRSSQQAALPIEARTGGEPDYDEAPSPLQALEQLLEWAEKANQRLAYEREGPLQFGGNPYLNPAFKHAYAAVAQAKAMGIKS